MKRGMIAMSIVATLSLQAEESKMTNLWKASPQYQEFVKMGAETSEPAKKLRDDTVLEIAKKELEGFKNEIDPKYQANMANKVDALPNGLKVLLAEINLKLKSFVSQERDAKDISTINILLYQYVESILYGKGIAERKMKDIATRYPELEGTEATLYLLNIGKLYDENAKINERLAKAYDESYTKEADKLFEKIKPSLKPSRSIEDIEKIKTTLKAYKKSIAEYDGKSVSTLMVIEQIAPEIKSNASYIFEQSCASDYDKASQIDKDIPATIAFCTNEIKKINTEIKKLQADSTQKKAIKEYKLAIVEYEKVILNLNNKKYNDAKTSYYIAKSAEEIAKWDEIIEKLKKLP